MKSETVKLEWVWLTGALAAVLWCICFYLTWSNFWIKISLSASILAAISLWVERPARGDFRFDIKTLFEGIASAAILYGIFWLGRKVSLWVLPFAGNQIGAIYGKGEATQTWIIFFLLLLITGPCEEIFWRGFLQRALMKRFGNWQGWAAATTLYACVHIWSFNFMLIGAAAVAGAFWGLHYWLGGRLLPVIISHAIWSAFIFAIVPMQ